MPSRPRLHTTRWKSLFRLLAVLAAVAQVAVALSAVAEGRDGIGAAAHVEASGPSATHYAHDEATCAACQARSVHGQAARLPAPGLVAVAAQHAAPAAAEMPPAPPSIPTNPARAPPSVI